MLAPALATVAALALGAGSPGEDLPPRPAARPLPPGLVEQRIVRRDPRIRARVDVAYPALAPGAPGAAAFDAWFAGSAERRAGDALAAAERAASPGPESTLTQTFEVPLRTARLVTVVRRGSSYTGGAHGMPFQESVTFDLERGRPLGLEDVFAKGPGVADLLLPSAMVKLGATAHRWKGAREGALGALARASSWTFLADGAVVTFPPYSVGPYSDGQPEVHFTWQELAPHLRAGSPLPPR